MTTAEQRTEWRRWIDVIAALVFVDPPTTNGKVEIGRREATNIACNMGVLLDEVEALEAERGTAERLIRRLIRIIAAVGPAEQNPAWSEISEWPYDLPDDERVLLQRTLGDDGG